MSLAMFGAAHADTVPTINFETTQGYTTGNIDGQQGWTKTGSYDVAVATTSSFPNASGFGFDAQALRLSNAVTSGAFGDQTFSPGLAQPAGETQTNKHFEGSFSIGSTSASQQPGLFMSVSPDNGSGARMSYVGFDDQANGIHVIFYDATDPGPLGTVASFNSTDVTTIDRTNAHTIKFAMDTIPGAGNDVVKIYVDGVLKHTGTSWEDYYRYDPEQTGNGNVVPNISKLLFREGGTAASSTTGNGYLVDNVALASTPPAPTTATVTIAKNLDGAPATATSANSTTFPMESTWNATNIGAGTGNYGLGPTGFNNPNPYTATTSDMTLGATYTTHELTGATVATSCTQGGAPYVLKGYSTGDSLAAAQSAPKSMTAPNFTDLQKDEFVIVWNDTCPSVIASGHIIKPTAGQHVLGKTLKLKATYTDGDTPNNDDPVQWAVRRGTCAAGTNTVFGNVDGHSDAYNWDGNTFTASLNIKTTPAGAYCFVFNPTDDTNQPDVRLTQNFYIGPNNNKDCKNNGWQTLGFTSQKQCTNFVDKHSDNDGDHDGDDHGHYVRPWWFYSRNFDF